MEKINGYTREEAASLVRYLAEGRRAGRTLTSLFSRYGKEHGRAAGSVRNRGRLPPSLSPLPIDLQRCPHIAKRPQRRAFPPLRSFTSFITSGAPRYHRPKIRTA